MGSPDRAPRLTARPQAAAPLTSAPLALPGPGSHFVSPFTNGCGAVLPGRPPRPKPSGLGLFQCGGIIRGSIKQFGTLAEWLRRGLQNLLQGFDSPRCLQIYRESGGIGIHDGLKIRCPNGLEGSSPSSPTSIYAVSRGKFVV